MSLPDFDFNDHHWHGVGTRECRETSGSPRTAFECGKSAPSAPCCTDVMHRLSMQDLFLLGQARGWGGSTSYCLLPYNPFQKRMSFQFGRRKKNKRMKTFVELQTAATKEPEAEVEDEEDDEDGGEMSKYKLDSDEVRAFFFPPVPLSMLVSKPFFSHSLSLHFHIQPHSRFILHWSKREGIRSLIGYHLKEILHGCESMQ